MSLKNQIEIEFVDVFVDSSGKKMNMTAGFFPETGKVKISLERIFSGEYIPGMDPLTTLIFVTAHETTHKVQAERGETIVFSDENPNYDSDPHEIEANFAGMDMYKAFNPNRRGPLTMRNVTYLIPATSSFTLPKQIRDAVIKK